MKLYRYNSKRREDRKFNNMGYEKNPNGVKFYAKRLEYAEKYRYIYFEDGAVNYECELEEVELDDTTRLANLPEMFEQTEAYRTWLTATIEPMARDYTAFYNAASKAATKKMWKNRLDRLADGTEERSLREQLAAHEFQYLSDGEYQTMLIEELTAAGYVGYETANEVAIF